MSLFGALLGDFDDDNFMGNPMNSMNMQMRNMNRLMNSMMMPDPFNMLTPFDNRFNGGNSLMERPSMLGGGGLFGFPNIPNMNRLLSADIGGNGASFCSSSVISMSSGPDGRPQIYQATSSTKTGPGGIRETRKTVQDSSSGVKKMAIGHHIGERAHIIEKEQNLHSGQHEERQEFINLDEEEAESFDREFTTKARMHTPAIEIAGSGHHSPHHRQYQRALPALPAPPSANTSSASSSLSSSPVTTTKATATKLSAMKTSSTTTTTASASASTSSSTSSQSSSPSSLSAATRRALRNASMATPRRPLRTPTSSPLALTTSGHNTASTTTSVHPHPYNNAAARRNFRAKHSKHQPQHTSHQQQHQQQQQQQHSPPQQQTTERQQQELLYQESSNTDSN